MAWTYTLEIIGWKDREQLVLFWSIIYIDNVWIVECFVGVWIEWYCAWGCETMLDNIDGGVRDSCVEIDSSYIGASFED
jgi:hypothetical protein